MTALLCFKVIAFSQTPLEKLWRNFQSYERKSRNVWSLKCEQTSTLFELKDPPVLSSYSGAPREPNIYFNAGFARNSQSTCSD